MFAACLLVSGDVPSLLLLSPTLPLPPLPFPSLIFPPFRSRAPLNQLGVWRELQEVGAL